MPKIIQFLHPNPEAKPSKKSNIISWNCGDKHKRKFLLSKGKYVYNNIEKDACLTFWGEWEPQSYAEKLPNLGQKFPTYLNRPFWNTTASNACHNTDPYVFGQSFNYFICQQGLKKVLRNLEPFSLILFGSCINSQFCLDTLFVVSDTQKKYKISNVEKLGNKNTAFYHASIKPLLSEERCTKMRCNAVKDELTFYKGVSFNEKEEYNNMFSFAPARLYANNEKSDYAFQRPKIEIPEIISPRLTQGINGNGGKKYSEKQIIEVWHKIVDIMNNNNLLLGTNFEEPVQASIKNEQDAETVFKC